MDDPIDRSPERDDRLPMGASAELLGLSPRMVRYLETQGVLRPDRRPGPGAHRQFLPPEVVLGRTAARVLALGHPTRTLAALRELADRKVADARAASDPLGWFELLALARAVDAAVRDELPPPDERRPAGPVR